MSYRSYEDLPLFLTAKDVAKALGISVSTAYAQMRLKSFPSLHIGRRKTVPRDKFIEWVNEHTAH